MAGLADLLNAHSQAQPSGVDSYLMKLLTDAQTQYPYLKQYNLMVNAGKGKGFAETYLPGDAGTPDEPRDPRVPLNRAGVTVFKPDQFHASDLAAEGLHLDPVSKMIRQRMLASLSPQQATNIRHSGDYRMSIDEGMRPDLAMNNGMDAALRGQVFGQWPADVNQRMQYTPQQQGLLSTLQHYVTTGHQ